MIWVCGFGDWRQYQNQPAEITIEHQFLPEKDTVIAKHYHKVDNKFYIITVDSCELWVDNIKLLNGGTK